MRAALSRVTAMAGRMEGAPRVAKKSSSKLVFGNGDKVLDRGARRPAPAAAARRRPRAHRAAAARAGVWKRYKYCAECKLIMVERAKWAKDWEAVKFCGDKCRGEAARAKREAARQQPGEEAG